MLVIRLAPLFLVFYFNFIMDDGVTLILRGSYIQVVIPINSGPSVQNIREI
jgi:hypothetical protein